MECVQINVIGTVTLLKAARAFWKERQDVLFHHISTDEVYGSLGAEGAFVEATRYDPRSPYSGSKAASDHFVSAYNHTYGLPVYGDGKNIRDWLYVEDHNRAVWQIMQSGRKGETYNIGGENEWENLTLVRQLCKTMAKITGQPENQYLDLISFVKDRPGHDQRYAINCDKLKQELGWRQSVDFSEGLEKTIRWYLDHQDWVREIESGEYRKWIEKNYDNRVE